MHAMEPNVNKRYASADELLHDLEEFRKNPGMEFDYKGTLVAATDATQKIATVSEAEALAQTEQHPEPVGIVGKAKQYMENPPSEESYAHARRRSARTSMLVERFAACCFWWCCSCLSGTTS